MTTSLNDDFLRVLSLLCLPWNSSRELNASAIFAERKSMHKTFWRWRGSALNVARCGRRAATLGRCELRRAALHSHGNDRQLKKMKTMDNEMWGPGGVEGDGGMSRTKTRRSNDSRVLFMARERARSERSADSISFPSAIALTDTKLGCKIQ